MAVVLYKNISSATTTTLITKPGSVKGNISKINICNNSANAATSIHVDLYDGSSAVYYICRNVTIPSGATLVLEDNVRFDSSVYHLSITTSSAGYAITVIIK